MYDETITLFVTLALSLVMGCSGKAIGGLRGHPLGGYFTTFLFSVAFSYLSGVNGTKHSLFNYHVIWSTLCFHGGIAFSWLMILGSFEKDDLHVGSQIKDKFLKASGRDSCTPIQAIAYRRACRQVALELGFYKYVGETLQKYLMRHGVQKDPLKTEVLVQTKLRREVYQGESGLLEEEIAIRHEAFVAQVIKNAESLSASKSQEEEIDRLYRKATDYAFTRTVEERRAHPSYVAMKESRSKASLDAAPGRFVLQKIGTGLSYVISGIGWLLVAIATTILVLGGIWALIVSL